MPNKRRVADPSRCWGLGRVGGSAFWQLDGGGLRLGDSFQTCGGLGPFPISKTLSPIPYALPRTPSN